MNRPKCESRQIKFDSFNIENGLAVLGSGFVKLYNLVHSFTGLTSLVHLLGVVIDHLVGAMPDDGLNLTIGAASFQKVDGGVLTKAMQGVFIVVTT